MATTKRAPKAKPAKRMDRRETTSTRLTPETRGQIKEAAAQSGRSLAQEIEIRLEQSFLDEEARDREWGGKKLHGLFRMMAGAREVIEQGRDKTCADDWETFFAVEEAWRVLQLMNLAPKDQALGDHLGSMSGLSEIFDLPPLPTLPKYPATEKELRAHLEKCERWSNAAGEFQKNFKAGQQHIADMERLGKMTVIEMFYTGARN